ncbi:histidine kinase CKI1-like [Hibiscus syriacus]|nr:histidine kinase CKI1-like [Hibiscus syriacus]
MDGNDLKLPLNRRRDALSFILLVIDVNAGQFFELWRIVAEFRRGLQSTCCKVVWLDKPTARMINPIRLDPGDEFLLQPFHGSRLHRVIKLLPEFGAASSQGVSGNPESSKHAYNKARLRNSQHSVEILEYGSSSDERYSKKRSSSSPSLVRTHGMVTSKISPIRRHDADSSTGKPLFGKRILIAEDNKMLSFIATTTVRQLGADVENCVNGNEAVELMFPLDGYEATRLIRTEEEKYGVHIPIIVLTAHTDGEEAVETGMDAHLVKPLKSEELMEVIENIQRKSNG